MSRPTSLYHPVTIGDVRIPGNLFLAPMAGYTDVAFRTIALREGADCTYTELISAEGILRGSKNTFSLLNRSPEETYWGVQIFTSSPFAAGQAVAKIVTLATPTLIDLNCGCPVPKVVHHGGGAALLKDPSLIYMIVKTMKEHTSIPVTVKIRSGWDVQSINYLETADAAVQGGASMVCLHPRTRTQGYGGKSDWNHITHLKSYLSVPVFGSGDLFTPQDVLRMLETTRCDGVMIARGAVGNPFIFTQVKSLLKGIPPIRVTTENRLSTALMHLDLAISTLGETLACREMRKHFCAYVKGIEGSAAFRNKIVHAESREQYQRLVEEYIQSHSS
ncbi:MAG: tRNA dihydrouridine synthase DusB [Spirochaetes bacterium]|nr:tRNA dihydrouridine synthase DusB [Spirochaetota bacterium]